MTMTRLKSPMKICLPGLLLGLAALPATAQDYPWYGGVGLGESHADFKSQEIFDRLTAAGQSTTFIDGDDKDLAYKLFVGYDFTPHWAVEASYFDLGKLGMLASVGAGAAFQVDDRVEGLGLDLVGTLPLGDRWALLAHAGVNYAEIDENIRSGQGGAFFQSGKYDGFNESYGLGVEYKFSDRFDLRADVTEYHLENDAQVLDDKAQLYSLSAVFHFGRAAPPPPPPAPVVQERPAPPPPAPAPPPEPEPPRPIPIMLSADTMFDFDKADLKPEGRQQLNTLVDELGDVDYNLILVTGHTDRIGSLEYNTDLSQRRADSVRDYLVEAGISVREIRTEGKAFTMPITTDEQCRGRAGADLIACYQPDRRVEVEVDATRTPE